MIDITNLPASIRDRLEASQQPAIQPVDQAMFLAEAIRAICSQNADLGALLLASHLGQRELTMTDYDHSSSTDREERKWLGITVASVERTVTRSWSCTKTRRFS